MEPHKLSITLTQPQTDWLREKAKSLGISTGELIRRIIDQHREGK
jgi:hypothetical protein